MAEQENTVIITDTHDGENLYKLTLPVARVLCLANEAREILGSYESKLISSGDTFNIHDEARCAAASRRFDKQLSNCLVDTGLDNTTIGNIVYNRSLKLLTKGFTFRRILQRHPKPWLVFHCGEWQVLNCETHTTNLLLQKTRAEFYFDIGVGENYTPKLLRSYETFLTRAIAKKKRGTPKILIGKTLKPGQTKFKPLVNLKNTLTTLGLPVDFICPRPISHSESSFQHLALQTYRLFRNRQVEHWFIPITQDQEILNSANRLLNEILEKVELTKPLQPWVTEIAKTAEYFQCFSNRIQDYIFDLKPCLCLLEPDGTTGINMAIAEACYRTETPIIFLPHGSYAYPIGRMGKWANQHHFYLNQFRTIPSGEILLKHPQELPLINKLVRVGNINQKVKISRVLAYSKITDKKRQPIDAHSHPTLLYAGASVNWPRYYCPWIMETDDNFVESIIRFSGFVDKLEKVNLVIRTKKIYAGLKEKIPENPNISVTSARSFEEDLSKCDVIISNRSTTIIEALTNRKPVILWSVMGNYVDYPSRSTPPKSSRDRAAVYSISPNDSNPIQFIQSIVRWHAQSPLTDSELQEYVWPEDTDSLTAVVRRYVDQKL